MNTEDSKIVISEKAQKVIEINNILFKSKRYIGVRFTLHYQYVMTKRK